MIKAIPNKTTIHTVAILPLGIINAFLLVNSHSCILVDTGLPDTENKIEKSLKKLGLSFHDIKLIVITHAHIDHAGNGAKLRSLSGAPIIAHAGDLPYYKGEKKMHFCSTGLAGNMLKKAGIIQQPYDMFMPDILLNQNEIFSLTEYGINGEIIPTPGHTDGSISIIIDNEIALVGDLVSSGIFIGGIILTSKAKRPPFEDNPNLVSKQLTTIAHKGVNTFYMGHGGPLVEKEVLRHANKLKGLSPENA